MFVYNMSIFTSNALPALRKGFLDRCTW